MKSIASILVILNALSVMWSAVGVFKKKEFSPTFQFRFLQLVGIIILGLSIYTVCTKDVGEINYIFLIIFQLVSLIGFWSHVQTVKKNEFSAVYSNDIPKVLVQHGFYHYIRNPFYFIYLLNFLSVSLFLLQPVLIVLSVIITIVYNHAASFEERKFLSGPLKDEYQLYLNRTGRFFPKIFK